MPALLRPAVHEDKTAIHGLMVNVIKASVDLPYQEETIENVTQNVQVWLSDPAKCLHIVAHDGSEIIGVVLVKEFWNLCSLFVAQEYQHRGIGRALVQAAIEGCRFKSPKQAISLNSSPQAFRFYRSLGFVPRESSQPLPPGFRPMRLPLSESEAYPLAQAEHQRHGTLADNADVECQQSAKLNDRNGNR